MSPTVLDTEPETTTALAAVVAPLIERLDRLEQLVQAAGTTGALDVDTFAARYGLGRTLVYELMNARELPSIKVRGRRIIPAAAAETWLRRCLAEQAGGRIEQAAG